MMTEARTLVVKVGSSLVTNEGRGLDAAAIARWAAQVAKSMDKPTVLGGMIPVDPHWLDLMESYQALNDIDVIAPYRTATGNVLVELAWQPWVERMLGGGLPASAEVAPVALAGRRFHDGRVAEPLTPTRS